MRTSLLPNSFRTKKRTHLPILVKNDCKSLFFFFFYFHVYQTSQGKKGIDGICTLYIQLCNMEVLPIHGY